MILMWQVEAVIHFEDDTEELQQWDQQVMISISSTRILIRLRLLGSWH